MGRPYLSDILPTAYQAVAYASTPKDGTLAVLGMVPVGQLAVRLAKHLGVQRAIGIEPVPLGLKEFATHHLRLDQHRMGTRFSAARPRAASRSF